MPPPGLHRIMTYNKTDKAFSMIGSEIKVKYYGFKNIWCLPDNFIGPQTWRRNGNVVKYPTLNIWCFWKEPVFDFIYILYWDLITYNRPMQHQWTKKGRNMSVSVEMFYWHFNNDVNSNITTSTKAVKILKSFFFKNCPAFECLSSYC